MQTVAETERGNKMKKRMVSLTLILCMMLSILPVYASAAEVVASGSFADGISWTSGDDITWVLLDDGMLNISGTGRIPSEPVNEPNYNNIPWYSYRDRIYKVNFEDGITFIGNCLADCNNVTEVYLPSTLESHDAGWFDTCSSLTDIYIDNNQYWMTVDGILYKIDPYQIVRYPNGRVGAYTVVDGVPRIGMLAFAGCAGLTSIAIPDSVTTIDSGAFANCVGLTSITIPDSVTTIDISAFSRCIGLKKAVIGSGVTNIPDYAFQYCTNLSELTVSRNTTSIGHQAFIDCENLTDVYYSGSESEWAAITIESGNTCLTNATIHYNSTGLDSDYSGECGDNLTWVYDGGTLIITGMGDMYDYESDKVPWADLTITTIIIANGVTSIGDCAFDLCDPGEDYLSIYIGDTVQKIGEYAFPGGIRCERIYFSGDAPQIDVNAFGDDISMGIDIYYDQSYNGWDEVIEKDYSRKSLAWIYSNDATGKLAEEDMWSFPNERNYFGDEGYYISKHDYDVLLSQLSKTEQKAVTNCGLKKNYNVDGKTWLYRDWGGSCTGMSVVTALIKNGVLSLKDFNSNAVSLSKVDDGCPLSESTLSLINFYQWQQNIPAIKDIEVEFTRMSQQWQIKKMEELISKAESHGNVVYIGYTYKKDDGEQGAHTILGYAIEYGKFDFVINGTIYHFDRRVLTYDPAYSGDKQICFEDAIYYNDTQWAMLGLYNIVSTDAGIDFDSQDNTAQLLEVCADANYINAVDYRNGETNYSNIPQNAYMYTIKGDFDIEYPTGQHVIQNGLFDGRYTLASDHSAIIPTAAGADSTNGSFPYAIALSNLASPYKVTTSDCNIDFALAYENYYLYIGSDQTGAAIFEPDGKAALNTEKNGTGYLSITANDGYSNLPWYTIDVVSEDIKNLSLELTEDGVVVSGDNLGDTTVYGTNDEETKELTFSTDEKSVLITNRDDELWVLADADGDGEYETPVEGTSGQVTYAVTFNANGGTVSADTMTTGADGKLSSLPVPVRTGYTFAGWYTDPVGGERITVDTVFTADTTVYAHWTKDSTSPAVPVNPTKPETGSDDTEPEDTRDTFRDVSEDDYFADAVEWAVESGVTTGTGSRTFSPNAVCTRAQAVAFLWRAAGSPAPASSVNPFADVKAGAYYYDAVLWAVEQGIVKGTSETTFSPEETVTRAQAVTFLWRSAGSPSVEADNPFADVPGSAYYAAAVLWAVENGITTGTAPTAFSPNLSCTRAQIVTFLYRGLKK